MTDPTSSLVLDLVEWVAARPRTYAEVMEAWRTSCPRLTVWEDALDGGLLVRTALPGAPPGVAVTRAGFGALGRAGRSPLARTTADATGRRLSAAPGPGR